VSVSAVSGFGGKLFFSGFLNFLRFDVEVQLCLLLFVGDIVSVRVGW